MSWRSIQEILDFEFCPKLWESMREQRFYNITTLPLLERFESRLKSYNENQQIKKPKKSRRRKKRSTKKSKENIISVSIVALILMISIYYYNVFYFFLVSLAIIILSFLYLKKRRIIPSKTKDVYLLIKEELKKNPKLELVDPPSSPYSKKTNVFGVIPSIQLKNEDYVIIMDRSDRKLPKYAQYAFHRDLIELVFYMYLINTNFFTTKITGIIQYHDDTRTLEWSENNKKYKNKIDNNKIKRSLNRIIKISGLIKKYHSSPKINVHFTRCLKCPLLIKGCSHAKHQPELQITSKAKENIEQTYQQFEKVVAQLEKTTWHHWKDQISTLIDIIQDSFFIKKFIKSRILESRTYDIDAMVDTAIYNQREIHNGHFPSKEYPTFCYQLLLYLGEVRKDRLKPLLAAYGQTERYDYKTSNDIKIRNFLNKTILQFLYEIGANLEDYLEKNNENKPTVVYNHFRQTLKIENNKGTIIQPTIKNM